MEALALLVVFLVMSFLNGLCLARMKGLSVQVENIQARMNMHEHNNFGADDAAKLMELLKANGQ